MSIFFGILLIALALLAVRVIWRAVALPRNAVTEPSCAKCHYPTAGLVSNICPECGSDLKVVGLLTPLSMMKRRGGIAAAIVAVSYLAVLATIVGLRIVDTTTPPPIWRGPPPNPFVTVTTLVPKSAAYESLDLEQPSQTIRSSPTTAPFDAALSLSLGDGGTRRFLVLRNRFFAAYQAPDANTVTGTLSAEAVGEWFRAAGLDTTDRQVQLESYQAFDVVMETLRNRFSKPTAARTTGFVTGHIEMRSLPLSSAVNTAPLSLPTSPRERLHTLVQILGFFTWLAAAVWIMWRRRSLLRSLCLAQGDTAAVQHQTKSS